MNFLLSILIAGQTSFINPPPTPIQNGFRSPVDNGFLCLGACESSLYLNGEKCEVGSDRIVRCGPTPIPTPDFSKLMKSKDGWEPQMIAREVYDAIKKELKSK